MRSSDAAAGILLLASTAAYNIYAGPQQNSFWDDDGHPLRHVLLISIDGMHAVDFLNCSKGRGPTAPTWRPLPSPA